MGKNCRAEPGIRVEEVSVQKEILVAHAPIRIRSGGEYRQFLHLIVCNRYNTVVPRSRDLDDFWHEHILDTTWYAEDCNTILGSFIHHNPHLFEGSLYTPRRFPRRAR